MCAYVCGKNIVQFLDGMHVFVVWPVSNVYRDLCSVCRICAVSFLLGEKHVLYVMSVNFLISCRYIMYLCRYVTESNAMEFNEMSLYAFLLYCKAMKCDVMQCK